MEDMPVFVVVTGVCGWSVLFDEGLQYVLVKQIYGFIAGEVGAVVEDGPVVAVSEELAAESASGLDGGVDLGPEAGEMIRRAEGEGETRVDERGAGDGEFFEVCVGDLDSVGAEGFLDFWSGFGAAEAVFAAVLRPDFPTGDEHRDAVASGSASEIYGERWVGWVDVSEAFEGFEDGVASGFAFHAVEVRGPVPAMGGFMNGWSG